MAKIYQLRRTSTLALRRRRGRLLLRMAPPPDWLRASFVERFTTCGKPTCRCARGQRHGPFFYLLSNLAPGRLLKFLLKTPAQQAAAAHGVAAAHHYRQQLEELSQLNAELLRRGELLSHD